MYNGNERLFQRKTKQKTCQPHNKHCKFTEVESRGFLRTKPKCYYYSIKIHTLSTFVFQQRMIESRPAEYNRPVFWSSWSAFTPDLWRGSSSSLITNDMVTFLLGMAWLWGWPCEWPEDGRIPAAILHLFPSQLSLPDLLVSFARRTPIIAWRKRKQNKRRKRVIWCCFPKGKFFYSSETKDKKQSPLLFWCKSYDAIFQKVNF